ncbi:outer membrane protein assembly factor BamB family protein [Spirosoma fluviale]|uniref:PQQ-like domain-containing protein n=1 Tax=Spirosoma fluviale TaxID=1597977 RepID=A0A286GLQ7_9BACT|nr:PQQ-binding-like beta-propeller repeat protein [Spirosoma fluviale]SOD96448.1 PQQ-like domain-containing protein [Spirosoma fluviale]
MKHQTVCSVWFALVLWTTSWVMAQPADTLTVVRKHVLRNGPSSLAMPLPNGFLLVGRSEKNAVVSRVDQTGAEQWSRVVSNLRAVSMVKNQLALVQQTTNGQMSLSVLNLNDEGKLIWRADVGPGTEAETAIRPDQSVAVVTRTPTGLMLYSLEPSGQSDRETPIALTDPEPGGQLGLLSLPDNGLVLTVGSTVIGLNNEGSKRWSFDFGRDKIQWNRMRLLRNGQVALVGQGTAIAFSPDNLDGRLIVLNPQTGHQIWSKVLTFSDMREAGIDLVEKPDQTLFVLMQEPTGASLLHLNARHELRVVSRIKSPAQQVVNYIALVQCSADRYGLVAATAHQTIWQEMGRPTPSPRPNAKRPALYGLSVGVSYPPIRFAEADARAIAETLQRQQGQSFTKVAVQLLNAPQQATTTQIGAAIERWSLTLKPNPDDWVLVFVSGLAIDLQHDLRLIGADYDQAAPRNTSLSLRQLLRDLNALPCRKLVLLDMGQPEQVGPPANDRTFSFLPRDFPNTYVLMASQPDQPAYEDPAWQHGAFTRALLDGLTGPADTNRDGQLRLSELGSYLSEAVPALVQTQKQKEQQPTWLIRQKDDAVLLEK